ncbi:10929_t:CDS:2, partial [Entrophospora sp. SA101]
QKEKILKMLIRKFPHAKVETFLDLSGKERIIAAYTRFLASARILVRAAEEHFLKIIKEALNSGEEIVIKDFFTIKRQIPKAKG